jgi:hypothetical protein
VTDKFYDTLLAECQRHPECQFEFVDLRKHRGIRVWWQGLCRLVTYSKSAGDKRAILNARTDLRRTIAQLKGEI